MLRHASIHVTSSIALVPPVRRVVTRAAVQLCVSRRTVHSAHQEQAQIGGGIYLNLKEVHNILNNIPPLPDAVAEASASDIEIINKALPTLQAALTNRQISVIQRTWDDLVKKDVLSLIGGSAHEKHAKLLAGIFWSQATKKPWAWSDEEAKAFESMAVETASAGYPAALTACMFLHINRGEPEAVHRLYASHMDILAKRLEWSSSTGYLAAAEFAEEEEEAENDEQYEVADLSASENLPLVLPHVLLCSITAHAMQNNFRGALQDTLQTGTRFSRSQVANFTRRLQNKPALKQQLIAFADRLNVARLIARHATLSTYINALIDDGAVASLQKIYTIVIEELSAPDPWITTDPEKVTVATPVLFPDFAWGLFLKGFLVSRQLPLAARVWEDIPRLGLSPSDRTWVGLLQGYAKLRMGEEILSAWKLMQQQEGITPSMLAYQAAIDGLLRSKMPTQALAFLHEFRNSLDASELQDASTLMVHNVALDGLLYCGEFKEAQALLSIMRTQQPAPSVASYNIFMQYHGDRNDPKAVAAVLELIDKAKLRGDVFTFSTLLTTLLKVRNDATQIVFDFMRKQGVKPNVVMYSGIINYLMKQKSLVPFTAALEVLRIMEEDTSGDAAPNVVTYTTVLTGLLRATYLEPDTLDEWRQDITRRMTERKLTPTTATYHVLMEAALSHPDAQGVQRAMLYYKEMPKYLKTRDTWWVILDGLAKRQEWAVANAVVADMDEGRFVPQLSLKRLVDRVRHHYRESQKQPIAN